MLLEESLFCFRQVAGSFGEDAEVCAQLSQSGIHAHYRKFRYLG